MHTFTYHLCRFYTTTVVEQSYQRLCSVCKAGIVHGLVSLQKGLLTALGDIENIEVV